MSLPITANTIATLLGITSKKPKKHLRLTDEKEPGPANELAAFVVKWTKEPPEIRRPVQAEFCARFLPRFFAAFDSLPPATTTLAISVLHSYSELWFNFNGHAHVTRYLIHHPKGRELAASILKHVDGCAPGKTGALSEPFIRIVTGLGRMLVCTLATYRYHIPLRLDAMPVLPPALVDACSPVFRRYQAGLSTRIRLRPSLEPVLKNSANYALNTVLILDVAAAEPVRVRNEWPAPNDLRMGSMKPYSFAEVRCEAHIGWTGMRDDELVEEGGPCEAPQMEGEGQDWKCIGCKAVFYCSEKHSRFHWKRQHKYECYEAETGRRVWHG